MSTATLFFLAVGLSMDACAVSVSNGMCFKNFGKRHIVITALAFGLFQALMPIIGYLAGQSLSSVISFLDHWIALILLGFIGGKMVIEAYGELKCPEGIKCSVRIFSLKTLVVQAVATSIDALAVGVSLAVMNVNIVAAASFIGIITFTLSIAGSVLGRRFGMMLKQKAEILGGVILILIGIKIFIEHMFGL